MIVRQQHSLRIERLNRLRVIVPKRDLPSRIVHHNRQRGMIVPLPRRLTIVGTRPRQTIVRRQIALRPISRRPGPNVRNNRNKLRRKEGARRSNASSRNLLNS